MEGQFLLEADATREEADDDDHRISLVSEKESRSQGWPSKEELWLSASEVINDRWTSMRANDSIRPGNSTVSTRIP